MRKRLWRRLIVVGAIFGCAQVCQAEVKVVAVEEQKAEYKTHEALMVASIENIEQTVAIYEKITDVESAKKALPELKKLQKERAEIDPASKELGEPTPEQMSELTKKYRKRLEAAHKKYMKELMRVVENNDIKALLEEHLK